MKKFIFLCLFICSNFLISSDSNQTQNSETTKNLLNLADKIGEKVFQKTYVSDAFNSDSLKTAEKLLKNFDSESKATDSPVEAAIASGIKVAFSSVLPSRSITVPSGVAEVVLDDLNERLAKKPEAQEGIHAEPVSQLKDDLESAAMASRVVDGTVRQVAKAIESVIDEFTNGSNKDSSQPSPAEVRYGPLPGTKSYSKMQQQAKYEVENEWKEYRDENGAKYWRTRNGGLTNIDPFESEPAPEEACRVRFGDQADIILQNAPEICGVKSKSESKATQPSPAEVRYGPLPGTKSYAKMQQQFEETQQQAKSNSYEYVNLNDVKDSTRRDALLKQAQFMCHMQDHDDRHYSENQVCMRFSESGDEFNKYHQPGYSLHLLVKDDQVVGAAASAKNGQRCEIKSFLIDEDARGTGASKQLMRDVVQDLQARHSCSQVHLKVDQENQRVQSFYTKMGFKETEVTEGLERTFVNYELDLSSKPPKPYNQYVDTNPTVLEQQQKVKNAVASCPLVQELRNLEPKNKIPVPSVYNLATAENLSRAQTLDDVARHPAVPAAHVNSNSDNAQRARARNLFRDAKVRPTAPERPRVDRRKADAATDRLNRAAARETELKFQQQQKSEPVNLDSAAQRLSSANAKYKVDLSQARSQSVDFKDPVSAEYAQTFVDIANGIGSVIGGRKGQIITGIADNFVRVAANMEKAGEVITKLQNAGADQSLSAIMGSATGAGAAMSAAQPFVGVLTAGFAIMNLLSALDADESNGIQEGFEAVLRAIQQAVEIITTQIARFEKNVMKRFDGIEKFLTAHHRIMLHAFAELKLDASDIKLEIANVQKKIQEGHAALLGQVASNQHMLGAIYDLSHYGFSDQVSREIQTEVDRARIAMEQSASDDKLNKYKARLANSAISNAKQSLVTGEATNIEDPVLAARDLQAAANSSSVINLLRKYLNKNFALSFAAVLPNPLLWSACANMYNEILCQQTFDSPEFPNESTASIDQLQLQKLIAEGESLEKFVNQVHSNGLISKLIDQYRATISKVKSLLVSESDKYKEEKVTEVRTRLNQKLERERLEIDNATNLKHEDFDRQIDIAQKHAERFFEPYTRWRGSRGELRMMRWRDIPRIRTNCSGCPRHHDCGGEVEYNEAPEEIRRIAYKNAHKQLEPKHKEVEQLKQNIIQHIAKLLQKAQERIAEIKPETLFAARSKAKSIYYLPNIFVYSRNKGLPPLRWPNCPKGFMLNSEIVQMYERGEIELKFEYEIKDDFFYVYNLLIEKQQYGDSKVTELQTFKIPWTGIAITPEQVQNFWEGGQYAQKQDKIKYYGWSRYDTGDDTGQRLPAGMPEFSYYPVITPYKPVREDLASAALEKTDSLSDIKTKMQQLVKQSDINLHAGLFKRILEQMQPSTASALYNAAKEMDYKYFALVNLIRLLYGQDKVYDFMQDRTDAPALSSRYNPYIPGSKNAVGRLNYMRTSSDIQTVFQRNIDEKIVMGGGFEPSHLFFMTNHYAGEAKKALPANATFSEHAVLERLKLLRATYPQVKLPQLRRVKEVAASDDILELKRNQDQLRGELGDLRSEFKTFSSDMNRNMALMLQLLQQRGRRRVASPVQPIQHESDGDNDGFSSDASVKSSHSSRQRMVVHNAESDSDNDYETD